MTSGWSHTPRWHASVLSLAVFLIPAFSLALPTGYSWGAALLVLLGLLAWPQVLALVFKELRDVGQWVKANPKAAAEILGPAWGNVDTAIVELANQRRSYDIIPVRRNELSEQQRIADTFFDAGLIPKKISTQDIKIWSAS